MKEYYISDGQNTIGPLSKLKLLSQNITKETWVWYEGLSEWKRVGDIDKLSDLFSSKQIPPPLRGQRPQMPPFSESAYQQCNVSKAVEPKEKKKSKKKIVLWCFGIFFLSCVFAVIGYAVFEHEQYKSKQEQYDNTISNESLHPESYLTLDIENVDFNNLTGIVRNLSKYTTYEQIQMKFSYYDKNGKVLQSNVYTIKGTFPPQSSSPCKVKVKLPKGLKNLINTTNYDVEIIGAKVLNN